MEYSKWIRLPGPTMIIQAGQEANLTRNAKT